MAPISRPPPCHGTSPMFSRRSRNAAGTDDRAALAAQPRPGAQEGGCGAAASSSCSCLCTAGRSRQGMPFSLSRNLGGNSTWRKFQVATPTRLVYFWGHYSRFGTTDPTRNSYSTVQFKTPPTGPTDTHTRTKQARRHTPDTNCCHLYPCRLRTAAVMRARDAGSSHFRR